MIMVLLKTLPHMTNSFIGIVVTSLSRPVIMYPFKGDNIAWNLCFSISQKAPLIGKNLLPPGA